MRGLTAGAPADRCAVLLPDCPLCGGNMWSSQWEGTRLRGCLGCGIVLHDRSVSREEEERLYDNYSSSPAPDEVPIAASQWRWLNRVLLPPDRRHDLSVLDIGCGHGAFLCAARADGGRVAGVELDPAGVASCLRTGLRVLQGSIFDVGVPPGPWDVVTMWDVLEHLEHPREALELAVREMKPGGILVLRGRNARLHAPFKAMYARVRGPASRLGLPDVGCVHRWGFGPAGYSLLLRDAGVVDIQLYSGIPTPGDRSGALGPATLARFIKGAIRVSGALTHLASLRYLYPFPSVLIAGRKPASV